MLTVMLGEIDIDFDRLQEVIETSVPSGMNVRETEYNSDNSKMIFDAIEEMYCYKHLKNIDWIRKSLGTLGGGNHFIEIDKAIDDTKFLVIHSGSRNLGKQVAEYYQNLAIEIARGKEEYMKKREEIIRKNKENGTPQLIQEQLKQLAYEHKEKNPDVPSELCYLTGRYRTEYLHDMYICQEFAKINRSIIARVIVYNMEWDFEGMFENVHNYIDISSNIVRKGAIAARNHEPLLIPINMRDGCILGRGKGNADWNFSAPHGAGRIMSRRKARESISMEDFTKSMDGIWSKSVVEGTLDESPFAYRSINDIMDKISDTVEVAQILKPIYNFKATD